MVLDVVRLEMLKQQLMTGVLLFAALGMQITGPERYLFLYPFSYPFLYSGPIVPDKLPSSVEVD